MERTEQDMIENKRAENTGLYDPSFEHDNCGIGAVVNIKGIKTHKTVSDALRIVENLEHSAGKVQKERPVTVLVYCFRSHTSSSRRQQRSLAWSLERNVIMELECSSSHRMSLSGSRQ